MSSFFNVRLATLITMLNLLFSHVLKVDINVSILDHIIVFDS